MTDIASPEAPRFVVVPRPPAPSPLSNALVFGWRAALKFWHVPEQLFDLIMTPLMFTLLVTCQATARFTSYGDVQFYEVSHNGAAPGCALTAKCQSARPGVAGRWALRG